MWRFKLIADRILRPFDFHKLALSLILFLALFLSAAYTFPDVLFYGVHARSGYLIAKTESFQGIASKVVIGPAVESCHLGGLIKARNVDMVLKRPAAAQAAALNCEKCIVVLMNSTVNDGINFQCDTRIVNSADAAFALMENDVLTFGGRFTVGGSPGTSGFPLMEGEVYSESRFPILKEYQRPARVTYKLTHGDRVTLRLNDNSSAEIDGSVLVRDGLMDIDLRGAATQVSLERSGVSGLLSVRLYPDMAELVKSNPVLSLVAIVFSLGTSIFAVGKNRRKEGSNA